MAFDPSPMLSGQDTYGPLRVPGLRGHMRLWNWVRPTPAAQNTLLVMKDGTVIEGNMFSFSDMYGSDVHRVFLGGYDHRCDVENDPFSFNALAAAGYPCVVPTVDHYARSDEYTDDYPSADSPAGQAAIAAARERERQVRISELQTELSALQGMSP